MRGCYGVILSIADAAAKNSTLKVLNTTLIATNVYLTTLRTPTNAANLITRSNSKVSPPSLNNVATSYGQRLGSFREFLQVALILA